MTYIIVSPSGDRIRIQFDESKPVSKIKVTLETAEHEDISKNVSFRKEG